jgi:histidinol-phosphate aminotransferase
MVKEWLNDIEVYKPGKPIEEVKRQLRISNIYKLASNEIPFAPYYLRSVILKEIKNINRYPESDCFYLKKELTKRLKVKPDQIIFGNGSDEIIVLALRALVKEKEKVLVAYPTFLIYEIQARCQGAEVERIPLKNFCYDLDRMRERITKETKIVFIANPDNPTGTYLSHKKIEIFLKKIPSSVVVFFDEAYFEFAPKDFPKTINFLKERGNIIFTRTFSKAYGLAGLRIGYGVTTQFLANLLNKVREPFNVNRIAQIAAISALRNKKFLKKVVSYIKKEKEYLYKELNKLNLFYIKSATNFILIDFKRDVNHLYHYLLKKGIIIRELRGWGLNNYFRVTIGLHKENKKFIRYLKEYLNQFPG